MESNQVHKLSRHLGAVNDGGEVQLYDTTGYTAVRREALTADEMDALIVWYNGDELRVIIDQLAACGFECEAGPLELNLAFIALCELAGGTAQPPPHAREAQ